MSYIKCQICGLRSRKENGRKRHFMARFPLDEVRCKLWVKITGIEDLAYVPIEKLHQLKYVCGKHFKDKDFKKKKTQLKKTAIPSIRLSSKPLPDEVLADFPYRMFKEQCEDTKEHASTSLMINPGKSEDVLTQSFCLENEIPSIEVAVEVKMRETEINISEIPSNSWMANPGKSEGQLTHRFYLENEIPSIGVVVEVETSETEINISEIPSISCTANPDKSEDQQTNIFCLENEIPSIEVAVEVEMRETEINISDVPSSINALEASKPMKAINKKCSQKERKKDNIDLSPRKKKLIRKLNKCKLTLKTFRQKAKIVDSIQSKALKTMLLSACKNQNRTGQGKRWSNSSKSLALAMYKKAPRLYRYFRQLVPMPSERTLQNILSNMPIHTGINKIVLNYLSKKACELSDKDKTCILAFDEMSLKKRLIYNHRNDNVEGYQDLGEYGRTAELADKALVLLLQGVHKKYKQPLAHYFVKGTISSEKLMVIIKNAIKMVSKIGYNVVATVCDQGPTNIGALTLLKKLSNCSQDNFFLVDNKKVYIIYDVPHLFKSIRNNFFEAGEMMFDGLKAKWRHIVELQEKNTETLHFKKITALHASPKFRAKMKVKLAAQILSNDVAAILKLLSATFKDEEDNDGSVKRDSMLQTASVIEQLDRLFDITNGPASRKDIKRGIRENVSKNSIHHKLWPEFKIKVKSMHFLKSNSQLRLRNVRCVNGCYTTISSLQDIWKYVESIGFKYLNLRQLNQDSLENLFGLIRQHSPTNQNPTCHHFTAALKTTILTKLSTPVRGANCEHDNNELIMDFHDLVFQNSDEDINKEHCYSDLRDDHESYFECPSMFEDVMPTIHLPDDEINIEEKLFETFEKQPVVYVSGYLASILIKHTSCNICWDSLRVAKPEENKIYNFIALKEWWKDKLSLTYPTLELCNTVYICVGVFERDVRPYLHNNDISKYCQLMMTKEVSTSWLCKTHHKEITEILLARLSNLLIRNECRKQNVYISDTEQLNADMNKKSQLMNVAK